MDHNDATRAPGAAPATPAPSEVPAESLPRMIWRRRWIVLLSTGACLAAAGAYLRWATPLYTSTAQVYVEQTGPRIIADDEGVMAQSKNYLYTQCKLIESKPILSAALEQPALKDLRTFAGAPSCIARARGLLEVAVGTKDDIISISFDSPYPEEAAKLANAVVDAYVAYHASQRRDTAVEVLKILEKEKRRSETELATKLQEVVQFKQDNGGLSLGDDRHNVIAERLAQLSEALTAAQIETIKARTAYETARQMAAGLIGASAVDAMAPDAPAANAPLTTTDLPTAEGGRCAGTGSPEALTGAELASASDDQAATREELSTARTRLAELARNFTARHPAVQAATAEVRRLETQLARSSLASAWQRYRLARQKEDHFAAAVAEQKQLAQRINVRAAQLAMLQSDIKRAERLCDLLDTRIKELDVSEDAGALNISVLEAAQPSGTPSKPHVARVLASAGVLGLMLGACVALIRDWRDQRLRSDEEIAQALGVPVLGVVPHMTGRLDNVRRGQKTHLDPKSPAAEAYRTVRTAVYFGVPDRDAKTLLVTSPVAGDGKTTLASNLAIAMAQAGQRTLVVDADFRKPSQHDNFEVAANAGLSSVLTEHRACLEVIHPTEVGGLDLLPCGPLPPNPSEVLNSPAFAEVLADLSRRYDQIVIDSPPVVPLTDARILAAMCDATLMVLNAEHSDRKHACMARDGLVSVGARILGAVVNDVPRHKSHYGYYSYPYGYYGADASDSSRRARHRRRRQDSSEPAEPAVTANAE